MRRSIAVIYLVVVVIALHVKICYRRAALRRQNRLCDTSMLQNMGFLRTLPFGSAALGCYPLPHVVSLCVITIARWSPPVAQPFASVVVLFTVAHEHRRLQHNLALACNYFEGSASYFPSSLSSSALFSLSSTPTESSWPNTDRSKPTSLSTFSTSSSRAAT